MSSHSKIEWTDATWNPIRARNLKTGKIGWHCEHATTGCEFCYAEGFNLRLGTGLPFKPGHRKDIEIFLDDKMLLAPLRWKKPRMIFVCSMTDLFADFMQDEWIDKMFAVMALCPQHTFQVLTKRAERMRDYLAGHTAEIEGNLLTSRLGRMLVTAHANMGSQYPGNAVFELASNDEHIASHPEAERKHFHRTLGWPLRNVWLGVPAEDQANADERVPSLLQTPAAVRFVSLEPLLGEIDISKYCWPVCHSWPAPFNSPDEARAAGATVTPHRQALVHADCRFLDWVIVGGESGAKARPMHPDWARSLRDQCADAGVPFFFKQWGEWLGITEMRRRPDGGGPGFGAYDHRPYDQCKQAIRVGKKAAGRLLDGVEHSGFPEACPQ